MVVGGFFIVGGLFFHWRMSAPVQIQLPQIMDGAQELGDRLRRVRAQAAREHLASSVHDFSVFRDQRADGNAGKTYFEVGIYDQVCVGDALVQRLEAIEEHGRAD